MRQLFALANDFKEGDLLVGGTRDDRQRADARKALLSTTVGDIRRTVFVDDGVTDALERGRDRRFDSELDPLSLARLKAQVLSKNGPAWVSRHRHALTSEVIAALAKVFTNDELSVVARSLVNPLDMAGPADPAGPVPQDVSIGSVSHFGSRIQPNSPGDDEDQILFSVLDGLAHGCGDVIIGLNPASDDIETIVRLEQLLERIVSRLELPTRYCVLSDIVKQHAARSRARVDVGFQSLAGTSRTLVGMVGLDVDGVRDLAGAFDGLYFETGQGSSVTNGSACDVDMVTLESRAYGVARLIRDRIGDERGRQPWTIVNDVAGFIGPEVFRTSEQLERACLEDVVMARLHGLTMGLDVCATFHMGIAPADLRSLTARIVERAAPAYLMAVAGNADPMLGYLTTSFREHPGLRQATGKRITSSMERRLSSLGVARAADLASPAGPADGGATVGRLYAAYCRAGGESRSSAALEHEAQRRLDELRDRGFDLAGTSSEAAAKRVDSLYANARAALSATLSAEVLSAIVPNRLVVRTASRDRDDYLSHPATGERLAPAGVRSVGSLYQGSRPAVQLVISDGLNALAVNEHLRLLLPSLRSRLSEAGLAPGHTDVVVENGRVRAGYEIGGLVAAEVVVHLLGERPGTGLNTLSAYVTYGRDSDGRSRWSSSLDHSATNAVCGIHPQGKAPERAAEEIGRLVRRMMEQRKSGVGL